MLEKLANEINDCLLIDQQSFKRKLEKLRRTPNNSELYKKLLADFSVNISSSKEAVRTRKASIPVPVYPGNLPINDKKTLIAETLTNHQVLILEGETGSGKTTQIPKICLELGFGAKGLIGHTQPRRLAARAVAGRIADELGVELGSIVGFQVRFSDSTSKKTLIKLMTDGILLAEIQHDRYLLKYEVLIIDEAHERSLNIDFLLGYLQQLLRLRPDLKIIITSATIDVDKFSKHFNNAPIISISGRTFPVDVLYRPIEDSGEKVRVDDPLSAAVLAALSEIEQIEKNQLKYPGDVLVFLSGEREIRDLSLELRKHPLRNTEVLPLYARLTPSEQNRIFSSHTGRRIILSTNVAETSLTVPGIVYVIDTGYARISRYSVQSKVQRLPIERISQANANQRAGRCGRVSHGTCIRLYSAEDFASRPPFTDPEIQRTNLSAVILQMLMLGLGEIAAFPFIEKPEQKAINDGFNLLFELGAIDKARRLTNVGKIMASIPADPRLARMLIEADRRKCLQEMLIIVSALGVQDPREFPTDKRQTAREKHDQFAHPDSDFLSWLLLWTEFESKRQDLSQNAVRQHCQKNFLSFLRMREWRETHRQLHLTCQQLGLQEKQITNSPGQIADLNYESIHRSILKGSLSQLGLKSEDGYYLGSRGRKFTLFPTSCLFKKIPKWVVTAELIETSRLYATLAAKIQPDWVVDAAQDLLKREYSEAHWERKRGEVVAFEKISLFGLTLIEKQRVSYSKIDPVLSREIFIREALVARNFNTTAKFYTHNNLLIDELTRLEEKQRRPDIVAGEEQLYEYYTTKIPSGIYDSRSFEHWLKNLENQYNSILFMTREELLQRDINMSACTDFPDQLKIHNNILPIDYRFKPGDEDDGASIQVHQRTVHQLTTADIDWAIPGQIKERCAAILKGLPKNQRKSFIPIPDFVDAFMKSTDMANSVIQHKPLIDTIRDFVRTTRGIELDRNTLNQIEVPRYLQPIIKVLGEDGKIVAKGQSLQELQRKVAGASPQTVSKTERNPLERDGIKEWDFGELPAEVEIQSSINLMVYPALVDKIDSVSLVLQNNPGTADTLTRQALTRLLMLKTGQQRGLILKRIRALEKIFALKMPNTVIDFGEECLQVIYRAAFNLDSEPIPRDSSAFENLLQGKSRLLEAAEDVVNLIEQIIEGLFRARNQLQSLQKPDFHKAKEDITEQIAELVFPGFITQTPFQWLIEYPRYFKAIELRADKLPKQIQKDSENIQIVKKFKLLLKSIPDKENKVSAIKELHWMLEELRVSLFAQTLKTKMPVSEKRVLRKLEEICR